MVSSSYRWWLSFTRISLVTKTSWCGHNDGWKRFICCKRVAGDASVPLFTTPWLSWSKVNSILEANVRTQSGTKKKLILTTSSQSVIRNAHKGVKGEINSTFSAAAFTQVPRNGIVNLTIESRLTLVNRADQLYSSYWQSHVFSLHKRRHRRSK
jgi:hypothetical protein